MTAPVQDRVEIREGVVFGTGAGRDLKCDIYEPPPGIKNGIGVLLVHGGGWVQGDRSQLKGYGILLGRRGYLCVASEYRLAGEKYWPAQIEDVKCAIRWMKSNAGELGIDPERLVIEGNSAGAHLVLHAAGTPNMAAFEGEGGNPGVDTSVSAVIAFYPPTGLDRLDWNIAPNLFGPNPPVDKLKAASPVEYAGPGYPPTLLMHGNADEVVHPREATQMYEALKGAGATVEMHMFANQPHAFDSDPKLGRLSAEIMLSFLDRVLAS